jgi:catechol O-methyltransferase
MTTNSDNDPFECFGASDTESDLEELHFQSSKVSEELQEPTTIVKIRPTKISFRQSAKRDESCGVLAFHSNTEQSLLMHVRNSIHANDKNNTNSDVRIENMEVLPSERVLSEIDWYCLHRHWMMCIGPEKGDILRNVLESAIFHHEERMKPACTTFTSKLGVVPPNNKRFIAVELGTYCGYGSIFLSHVMKKCFLKNHDIRTQCQLLTVEINPEFATIAKEMIELAQVQDVVTVLENHLLMDGTTSDVAELIQSYLSDETIDFLMIDHDNDSYLKDLKILEKSGLIRSGTVVVADNVIFAGITDYMEYMNDLAKRGIVETWTKEALVEYCSQDMDHDAGDDDVSMNDVFKDGVGEFI